MTLHTQTFVVPPGIAADELLIDGPGQYGVQVGLILVDGVVACPSGAEAFPHPLQILACQGIGELVPQELPYSGNILSISVVPRQEVDDITLGPGMTFRVAPVIEHDRPVSGALLRL